MKVTRLLLAAIFAAFLVAPAAIADHRKDDDRGDRKEAVDKKKDRRDHGKNGKHRFHKALLIGGEENLPVVSDGIGVFKAKFLGGRIFFLLAYARLDTPVTQAHIHLGNPGTNGPVTVFLCTNIGGPPGVQLQPCPPPPAVVTGVITPDDVLPAGPPSPGLAPSNLGAGDLRGLKRLIKQGATYVNVHTEAVASGEIRGQVDPRPR